MISLIGLPGSGKSTVGRQLARRLQLPFFDSDHVIEERLGCAVRVAFVRDGESMFRDLEELVLDELTNIPRAVVSTGGGAVLRPSTRERLRERGQVVYLSASPDEIHRRLRHDVSRPLLQVDNPLARLRELYTASSSCMMIILTRAATDGRPVSRTKCAVSRYRGSRAV